MDVWGVFQSFAFTCCLLFMRGTHLVDKFLEVVSGLLLPLRGKEKVPALKSCCLGASSFQQSWRGPGEGSSWGSEDHSRLLISEWLGSPPWNFLGETACHPFTWQGGYEHHRWHLTIPVREEFFKRTRKRIETHIEQAKAYCGSWNYESRFHYVGSL